MNCNQIKAAGGKKFINEILGVISPLLRHKGKSVYFLTADEPLHMVIGRGNVNPMHQDKKTGKGVYEQSYDNDTIQLKTFNKIVYTKPSYGLRILIDLGSFDDHKERCFKIAEKSGDDFIVKLRIYNRIIAMNAGAAGASTQTPFFHGRFGDGISVQLDISLNGTMTSGKAKHLNGTNALRNQIGKM